MPIESKFRAKLPTEVRKSDKKITPHDEFMGQIVKLYGPLLLRHVKGLIKDHGKSEDIVQETFVRAWKNVGKLQNPETVRGWLFTVATRIVIDSSRRHQNKLEILEEKEKIDSNDYATKVAEKMFVHDALKTLPPIFRDVLEARYFQDLTINQIAQKLQISPGIVRRRLAQSHQMLKENLKDTM